MVTQNITQKLYSPVPVITSGYNTAVENVPILVGKTLYNIAKKLPRKRKDTINMI